MFTFPIQHICLFLHYRGRPVLMEVEVLNITDAAAAATNTCTTIQCGAE